MNRKRFTTTAAGACLAVPITALGWSGARRGRRSRRCPTGRSPCATVRTLACLVVGGNDRDIRARGLADAGLLDGKTATTHRQSCKMLDRSYPSIHVVRGRRFVEHEHVAAAAFMEYERSARPVA